VKKVSIIVPVYNVERYVEKCILSILTQSYQNIEIIIVDDGSTDGSYNICANLQKESPDKIKLLKKENGGLSSARNFGLLRAQGEYISFVDSDDIVSQDFIEKLVFLLEETSSLVSCCQVAKFNNEEKPKFTHTVEYSEYNTKKAIELLVTNKIPSHACNKLYTASLFQNTGFPINRNYEDIFIMYKIFKKAKKIAIYNNAKLYGYLQRGGSITGSVDSKSLDDYIDAINQRYYDLHDIIHKSILDSGLVLDNYYIYKESIKGKIRDDNVLSKRDLLYEESQKNIERLGFKSIFKNVNASWKAKILIKALHYNRKIFEHIIKYFN